MSSDDRFDDHLDDDFEDSSDDDLQDDSSDDHSDHVIGSTGSSTDANADHSSNDHADDSTNDSSRTAGQSSSGKGSGKEDKHPGVESFNVVNATEIPPGGTGAFESLATAQRDKLTGLFNGAKVKTTYTWLNLGDSLLKDHGHAGYDIVENFTVNNPEGSDELLAPQSITATAITTSNGNISKLVAGKITAKVLSADKFVANSAAAFTCDGFEGLFVVFNDRRDGYQHNSDTLIFLQNYNLASGPLVVN